MIGLLAKRLAYSLEPHGKQGVTLEKEIQMTNMYLEIQTIRFKKRFDFAWSVQDDLHSMRVPCKLFKPILENVINHGFEGKKKIHITITITAVGETATICIENNGKAIDEKNLAMLNDPQTDALLQRHALGIPNTRKRLALFSGNRSSLTIENTHEGTVRVLLMLPVTYTAISPSNP
jgi:two-component system sensor histidine kinase YesM